MGLAAKIEVEIIVRTSGALEDTHGFSARGGTSAVRNEFPDGIGTNITRPPTVTRAIFFRWIQFLSVHWEMPRIFAAWGTLRRGSITSRSGEGACWSGLGRVAMVVSLRNFVWPQSAYSTALGRAANKVRNRPRGWSAGYCVDRNMISVK